MRSPTGWSGGYWFRVVWIAVGLLAPAAQAANGPGAMVAQTRPKQGLPQANEALSQGLQQARRRFRQAQARHIDSLQALVQAHPQADTVRVKLLLNLADEMEAFDVRAAGPVIREAVTLARQVRYRDLLAEALLDLADYHIALTDYPAATARLRESRAEFRQVQDVGGQMRILNRQAIIADRQGRYVEALGYCYRARAMGSTGNERRFHTTLTIQTASIYTRLGEYTNARTLLLAALRVSRIHDYPDRINLIFNELGELSRHQGKWAAARRYYQQSLIVSHQINDLPDVLATELNLAEVEQHQGHYGRALRLGYGVLHRAQLASLVSLIPRAQVVLAQASLRNGWPDSAIWYARQGWEGSQRMRFQAGIRDASQVLAVATAQRGQFAEAYRAQQRVTVYNDSLNGADVSRRINALQFNQELQQQRGRYRQLSQQRELERLRTQRNMLLLSGLLVLAVLVGGGLLWRYRRQQARETALRTRLAANLHHDVGTLLSQISLQSSQLQEGLADATSQREQLGQISEASRSAIRQLNDVVWSLDAHNDHLPDLLARMRDYAHDVLGNAGLEVVFEAPASLPQQRLPVLLRRNLYLIYKEALHNVLKHARAATRVTIELRILDSGRLVLSISDDGQTEVVPVPESALPYHRRTAHGLRNISQRAAAVGGEATAGSGPGGFRLRVQIPLSSG
ncbi:tetratricopeptide repeat-containing sensor histidine kinase [Hymenobacter psychrophilus]|nr:tetratricopeptide repeat-containing sensor histidine kinase [Hymenobacter psychrophilus]